MLRSKFTAVIYKFIEVHNIIWIDEIFFRPSCTSFCRDVSTFKITWCLRSCLMRDERWICIPKDGRSLDGTIVTTCLRFGFNIFRKVLIANNNMNLYLPSFFLKETNLLGRDSITSVLAPRDHVESNKRFPLQMVVFLLLYS